MRSLVRRAAQDIVDIGLRLIDVKERLPGAFEVWLHCEFDWSARTGWNFIQVAQRFSSANFADAQIAPSALYLLASPSIPESARVEALDRANLGQPITHATAREIIEDHKETPAPKTISRSKYRPPPIRVPSTSRGARANAAFPDSESSCRSAWLVHAEVQSRHVANRGERGVNTIG